MNEVQLIGYLTSDPKVRTTQNGVRIANYTLAINRFTGKNQDNTADFIYCAAFGRQAETAEQYLTKGSQIAVTGSLRSNTYTNSKGNRVFSAYVAVRQQKFLNLKKNQHKADGDETEMEGQMQSRMPDDTAFENASQEDGLPFS